MKILSAFFAREYNGVCDIVRDHLTPGEGLCDISVHG